MKNKKTKFIGAAVQASPVYLNQNASTEKACFFIEEASKKGAELVALPEVFIPGGPHWAWHMGIKDGIPFFLELFDNSVEIPSEVTSRLGETARRCGVHVVIGVNERDKKTLYNTLLFFNDKGEIIGKHRKLKPTGAEKLVWGEGDGSTHRVYETSLGVIGGLICGEHTMSLPGFTLASMGEQVHIAAWIGFGFADISLTEICSRYYAIAYNTYVICTQSMVDQSIIDKLGLGHRLKEGNAWSAIIESGTGKILSGPIPPDQEGIVCAEIDLQKAKEHYQIHETTGHYWPKQFRVLFDPQELKPLIVINQETNEAQVTKSGIIELPQLTSSMKQEKDDLGA